MSWVKATDASPHGAGWDYPPTSYAENFQAEIERDASRVVQKAQLAGLTPDEALLGVYLGEGTIDSKDSLVNALAEFEQYISKQQTWADVETATFGSLWDAADDADSHRNALIQLEDGIDTVITLKAKA